MLGVKAERLFRSLGFLQTENLNPSTNVNFQHFMPLTMNAATAALHVRKCLRRRKAAALPDQKGEKLGGTKLQPPEGTREKTRVEIIQAGAKGDMGEV